METIIEPEKNTGVAVSNSITAEQVNQAFEGAIAALKGVAEQTREFAMRCVVAGELLGRKREELAPARVWCEWLATNCPDISRMTAHRLITIAENYNVSGAIQSLPDRLSSVEALYLALKGRPQDHLRKETSDLPPPSRVIASLARFWAAITHRPASDWDEMERAEFLADLAERERIRKDNGWDLPVIDVDATTASVN